MLFFKGTYSNKKRCPVEKSPSEMSFLWHGAFEQNALFGLENNSMTVTYR